MGLVTLLTGIQIWPYLKKELMEQTKLKVTSSFNNFLDGCVQKRDRVGHRAVKSPASQE